MSITWESESTAYFSLLFSISFFHILLKSKFLTNTFCTVEAFFSKAEF